MEKPTSDKVKDFQCPLCPSSFGLGHHLTRHIRSHVKEKPFECNQCTYKSGDSSDLSRHVKAVHEKLTPYRCLFPGCNYKAAKNGNLVKHRLTHETDPSVRRPFPCTFEGCDYRATQKSTLGRHIQGGHNESRARCFVCTMCSAGFYSQRNLQGHIKGVHVKESVHSCRHCEFKSSYASNMRKHLTRNHGEGGREGTRKKITRPTRFNSIVQRRQEKTPKN